MVGLSSLRDPTLSQASPPAPILLYDGTCGFCAASVRLVLRHDRRHTLRFASLQGEYGTAVRSRHGELDRVDSIVWVDPDSEGGKEAVAVRSEAALRVARYLGGWWTLGLAGWVIPRPIRDALYDLIARNRHKLVGGGASCLLPDPEVRQRFLDIRT
jgi:predicted DCC family thiol-disulfide oxidoreductase YuxK